MSKKTKEKNSLEKKRTKRKKNPHVLLELRAFLAVVGVRRSQSTADDAAPALAAVVALVADADQGGGAHERVTDNALAVACFAGFFSGFFYDDEGECCCPLLLPPFFLFLFLFLFL